MQEEWCLTSADNDLSALESIRSDTDMHLIMRSS